MSNCPETKRLGGETSRGELAKGRNVHLPCVSPKFHCYIGTVPSVRLSAQ